MTRVKASRRRSPGFRRGAWPTKWVPSADALRARCANCGQTRDIHCREHLLPCCPGKCP